MALVALVRDGVPNEQSRGAGVEGGGPGSSVGRNSGAGFPVEEVFPVGVASDSSRCHSQPCSCINQIPAGELLEYLTSYSFWRVEPVHQTESQPQSHSGPEDIPLQGSVLTAGLTEETCAGWLPVLRLYLPEVSLSPQPSSWFLHSAFTEANPPPASLSGRGYRMILFSGKDINHCDRQGL